MLLLFREKVDSKPKEVNGNGERPVMGEMSCRPQALAVGYGLPLSFEHQEGIRGQTAEPSLISDGFCRGDLPGLSAEVSPKPPGVWEWDCCLREQSQGNSSHRSRV